MEFFGDADEAAPQLNRVQLPQAEAGPLFEQIIENIELFLSLNRVHGDLSPHNILYFDGQVRVIDFPQSVDPRFNRNARDLLVRDVANVCRYFAEYGVEANSDLITHDLWRRFTYGLL
jgi:RIO kinase 1